MSTPQPVSSAALLASVVAYPALLNHEEATAKRPYDVQGWVLYLAEIDDLLQSLSEWKSTKKDSKRITLGGREDMKPSLQKLYQKELISIRIFCGTRSTRLLPGSFKLWRIHLLFLMGQVPSSNYNLLASPRRLRFHRVMQAFEVCLMRLSRMPRLWLDYLQFVVAHETTNYTAVRRLFQRCLEALPVTQHDKIWPMMLQWATNELPVVESTLRILRRHAYYYDTTAKYALAQTCTTLGRPGEAAGLYVDVMNDNTTMISKSELWNKLAETCTTFPEETRHIVDFPRLVKSVLLPTKQPWSVVEEKEEEDTAIPPTGAWLNLGELEGSLWAKLAEYYTRMGDFDLARSTYEEGMETVNKVRDFSILFDAYIKLEEGITDAMMMEEEDEEEDVVEPEGDSDDWDILLVDNNRSHMADMELALARAEHLISRRPLLLNRVLLKQNPHNVGEWIRRADLYQKQGQNTMATASLEEALTKVHARRAMNGTPCQLVLALANLYDTANARKLFQRICQEYEYSFRDVDDLAQCYAAWVELELQQESWDDALSIARQAVATASTEVTGSMAKVVKQLSRSLRLWDLLLDLEESLGTLTTTKDSYSRAFELKVATPMHVLNFAAFLKDHKYFEESFSAYERGVEMFTFPASKILWNTYLTEFIERYKGQKVERVRDLFERCLEGCPPDDASEFCILNGSFEEEFGLTKRALNVYKDMCLRVPKEEKYTAYKLYIAKTVQYMGVTATRDIYQEAISSLDDEPAAKLCVDFCVMETSLHELDRARAVLTYGAQMADPRRLPEYWQKWHDFEVSHGNEETFREMLRIKRSVQAAFSTVNYNAMMDQEMNPLSDEQAISMIADQEGVEYQEQQRKRNDNQVFVAPKRRVEELEDVEDRVAKLRKAIAIEDDEIDIDDLDNEGDDEPSKPVEHIRTKEVPAAVFGGLTTSDVKQ